MIKFLLPLVLFPSICSAGEGASENHFKLDFYRTTSFINDMKLSQAPSGSILMFGDSITQSINGNDIHFDYVNLGIGGDTTRGVLERLMASNLGHYKGVFVSAGTNNLIRGEDGLKIGDEIEKIINYTAPRSKELYISEVFSPDRNKIKQVPSNFNDANLKIKYVCGKYKNCTVIPIPKGVITENGISPDMSLEDGVHLNPTAYKLWKIELNKAMANFPVNYYYRLRY